MLAAEDLVRSGIDKRKDPEEVMIQKEAIINLLAMLPTDGSVSQSEFNERICSVVQDSYRRWVQHGRAMQKRSERYCLDS